MKKIVFILDDEKIFHPKMLVDIFDSVKINVDYKLILVKKVYKSNRVTNIIKKNIIWFPKYQLLRMIIKVVKMRSMSIFSIAKHRKSSIEKIAKNKKIEVVKVYKKINQDVRSKIIEYNPDIIITSTSLIFDSQFIQSHKGRIINRHSGSIKKYGGVWPVIYSVANSDEEIVITLHHVVDDVDKGGVVEERSFKRSNGSLFDIYNQAFKISGQMISDLINNTGKKIEDGTIYENAKYNSFPNRQTLKKFLSNGGCFY